MVGDSTDLKDTDHTTDFDAAQFNSLTWASGKGMQPGTNGDGSGWFAVYNDTTN